MSEDDVRVAHPVEVSIKNWADAAKPPRVQKTTVKTHIIDPASATAKNVQICEYEPKRLRMVIHVIDVAVALTLEAPVTSPDTSAPGVAPQGRYLPPSLTYEYIFYGPDAMWLNALTAVTRVTVTKEYC